MYQLYVIRIRAHCVVRSYLQLCSGHTPEVGTKVVITGWSTASESGMAAQQLQAVNVFVLYCKQCSDCFTAAMLCASVKEDGKNAC